MEAATAELDTDAMSTSLAADLTGNMDLTPSNEVDDALAPTPEDTDKVAPELADAPGANRGPDGKFSKAAPADAPVADPAAVATPPDGELPVPKSWGKETHELWQKAARGEPLSKDETRTLLKTFNTRESQMAEGAKAYATDAEYGRSMRSVLGRHEDILRAEGVDAPRAVEYFFTAHRQLTSGTQEQRQAYLGKLADRYGLSLPAAAPADPNAPQPAPLPPEVRDALARVSNIENALTAQQQREYSAVQERTSAEVNAFAADPKHPYFDEVAPELINLIAAEQAAGRQPELGKLYEAAVWANPVTRQKELTRIQQETGEANRKKAEEAARAAKKSTSTNLRGRDTARAPQAPAASLDNLDDVMRETHEEIRSRA